MKKVWIDLETGGLDATKNAILQVAMVIENEKGKVVDTYKTYVCPPASLSITDKALEINGITRQVISKAPMESKVIIEMVALFEKHQVSDRVQFEFCGYNSRFDMDFVVEMFNRNKQFKYWNYFNYYDVDVFALVKILGITGKRFDESKRRTVDCKKLSCICELFDIKFDAHDALEDIKATRKLYKKLTKRYLK